MRASSVSLLLAVCCAMAVAATGRDFVCNGRVNPRQRNGICGLRLYSLAASYCCWYCHSMRVLKHNPHRWVDMARGDSRHFNFTQCRSDAWRTGAAAAASRAVQQRRSGGGGDLSAQLRKFNSLDRSSVWQISATGADLHCDCCVNSCTIDKLLRYCSCTID